MVVDSFGKGGKKGGKKGKGHGTGSQNKGGKGKPKSGTGNGAGSLEQGDQAAAVEPQPQPALASSLDLASLERPGKSPHVDPEGWDGHTTWVRRSWHFHWMQSLAQTRRRINVATKTASGEVIADRCCMRVQGTTV